VALLEAGAAHARAVATLGARSDLRLLSESERIEVHERGWIEFADERSSGGKLRLSRRFFEDLERHAAESALEHALSSLQARLLFVHGEEDSQVACAESEALFHWSRKDGARMILVEKTGHAFGTKEPFTGPSSDLERVVGSLLAFFESAV
jgi:pimeloyl-ACP methyl ester carboxylesterase